MAMSDERLGAAIMAAMDSLSTPIDRTAMFKALAGAIIDEIQQNAQVSTTVGTTLAVESVSGILTGTSVSGPGTGTGSGTGTGTIA